MRRAHAASLLQPSYRQKFPSYYREADRAMLLPDGSSKQAQMDRNATVMGFKPTTTLVANSYEGSGQTHVKMYAKP